MPDSKRENGKLVHYRAKGGFPQQGSAEPVTLTRPDEGVVDPGVLEEGASLQIGCDEEFLRRRVILNAQHIGLAAHLAVFNVALLASRGFIYRGRVPLAASRTLKH